MTETQDVALEVSIVCPQCQGTIRIGDRSCPGCARKVTRDEQQALRRRWAASDRRVETQSEDTYWGKVALAIAAGSKTLMAILVLANDAPLIPPIVAVSVAGLFWLLFVASFRAPLVATAVGVAAYGLLWGFEILFSPAHGVDGYLMRTLIITGLAGAAAAEWRIKRKIAAVRASRLEK